jgi:hypothetical protein
MGYITHGKGYEHHRLASVASSFIQLSVEKSNGKLEKGQLGGLEWWISTTHQSRKEYIIELECTWMNEWMDDDELFWNHHQAQLSTPINGMVVWSINMCGGMMNEVFFFFFFFGVISHCICIKVTLSFFLGFDAYHDTTKP